MQCDELHPVCRNCIRAGKECDWVSAKPSSRKNSNTLNEARAEAWLSFDAIGSHIAKLAGAATAKASTANSLVYILRHFETSAFATLSNSTGQQILKTKIPHLVDQYPFLLHSVLAYSASHLRYLKGDIGNINATARFHTSKALSLYSERLHQAISGEEMDAMFAACLLLTGLFFVDDEPVPINSWSTRNNGHYGWITMASGLPILLNTQKDWDRSKSFWLPFLAEVNTAQQHSVSDIQHVPRELFEVCASASLEVYTPALVNLGSIMRSATDNQEFARLISFPSRLSPDFNKLVYLQDSGALLILTYWFALMQRVPYWWCMGRTRHECQVLCQRLRRHSDAKVRAALRFPLEASKNLCVKA